MTITFIAGTTAELIKISPLMRELDRRGCAYQLWSTAQHVTGVEESLAGLGVRAPDRYLLPEPARAHIAAARQVPGWALRIVITVVRQRRQLRSGMTSGGTRGVVVVHGDTFTTVLGSLIGVFLGARVAHVEAGLRSGSLRNPFPEELNRRIVAGIATVHFARTSREVANLRRARGTVVETGANTVVDALRQAATRTPAGVDVPPEFGLVTLHRFELLHNRDDLAAILAALAERTAEMPLILVAGQAERRTIREVGLDGLAQGAFRVIDKLPYAEFLPLLLRASFVVTDSGGLQEECAALGIPCAVHRERTERHQGIGENVILTGGDVGRLHEFLSAWRSYRRPSRLDEQSPSELIAAVLVEIAGSGAAK